MFQPAVELKLGATEAPDMRLVLHSRTENVALVRQALSALADALGFDDQLLGDMKGAVSEACNNVVLHAYDGGEGILEVYMCPDGEDFDIVVRDAGSGIRPNPPDPDSGIQGVGLSLIQALTHRVEFRGVPGQGTEVRMGFHTPGAVMPELARGREAAEQVAPPAGEAVVSVVAGSLAAPVISRVVSMLAARSGFSVDRLADVQLLSDALAAHAPDSFGGRHIHVGIVDGGGSLELRVGPLDPGGGLRIVEASAIGGMPAVIEQLVDGLEVASNGQGEQLLLRMADAG
jgi:serine/threonine-protein kinase RsbW